MRFASSAKIVLMAAVPSDPRSKVDMIKRKVVPPLRAGRLKEGSGDWPFRRTNYVARATEQSVNVWNAAQGDL